MRKGQQKPLTLDEVKTNCSNLAYLPVDPQVYGKLQYMCNRRAGTM